MMTANAGKSEAERIKDEANKLFQEKHYDAAIDMYTRAIKLDSTVPAYWTNRSFAYLKTECYGYAIRDADEALKLDPAFIKAYYRRASANMALLKFKDSLKDFRMVVKYAPNDPDARKKLVEVEKIVRKMDFEKALSYDVDRKSVVETLNVNGIMVEADYDGMRWDEPDAPLTLEFVDDMLARFEAQKKIHRKYAYKLMLLVKALFDGSPTLVDIQIPEDGVLTVCGDVHGQYYDLLNIFRENGAPSPSHAYLFNGDFVDRGSFSAEVILALFAYKALYPQQFFMSRGNHETDDMNRVYGFEGEIKNKYSDVMFKLFSEIFNAVPLGNVIENRIFVVHGGLFSRDNVTLQELREIDRFRQPSNEGLMCEMLWSDPQPELGRAPSKRGVGLQFGPDVTKNFLDTNNLDMVIRSHEVKEQGYTIDHDGKCVTVFSAPNYCDQMGNKGAYINIRRKNKEDDSVRPELDLDYVQFFAVPHPAVKPMQYSGMYGGMFGL